MNSVVSVKGLPFGKANISKTLQATVVQGWKAPTIG